MEIEQLVIPGRPLVEAYGPGSFRIGGIGHQGSVLLLPDAVRPWPAGTVQSLTIEAFAEVGPGGEIDLLVVGTGAKAVPFPPHLRQDLRARGIVVEAMATPSACRTYNILAAEGRRVAAALIALPAD